VRPGLLAYQGVFRNGRYKLKQAAVDAILEGLKAAGVDFISLLPDSDFSQLQRVASEDAAFEYVPVSTESIGVGVCTGAWLAGKRPALLIPTSGLLVASWPLTSINMAWGVPLLLLIPYRGDIGDAFWMMGPYKNTTEPLLDVLHIPHTVVSRIEDLSGAIVDAFGSTISWQRPVAVLLTGETIK
jgi:sulfopyruvate decarboxylase subunit alpha